MPTTEPRKPETTYADFARLDLRVGTIVDARSFPEARRPALKLRIDFGSEIGVLKSSAQITDRYTPEALIGRQVVAVVNFPPKQIGPLMSACLILGAVDAAGVVTLLQPEGEVENGLPVS